MFYGNIIFVLYFIQHSNINKILKYSSICIFNRIIFHRFLYISIYNLKNNNFLVSVITIQLFLKLSSRYRLNFNLILI